MLLDTFPPPHTQTQMCIITGWLLATLADWTGKGQPVVQLGPSVWLVGAAGRRSGSVTGSHCRAVVPWPRQTHSQAGALCCTCFPGRDGGDKRARNFPRPSFGVFGQLQGPHSAPGGLSAGLESESDQVIRQSREHWAITRGSVCVSVRVGDEESMTSLLKGLYKSHLSHV